MKATLLPLVFVVIVSAFTAFGQAGLGVDLSFNAVPSQALNAGPVQQRALVQPDRKIIVYGGANAVDGVAAGSILRLNTDGTIDPTFTYCGCGVEVLERVLLLPDGKLIISGSGLTGSVARLNSDGSLDSVLFGADASRSYFVEAVQPDGKLLVTERGSFQGFSNWALRRFNADGTPDGSFAPINLASGSPSFAVVGGIEFLPDGRFYLAVTSGSFGSSVSLTRRNVDGSIDASWASPSFSSGGSPSTANLAAIDLYADGSLLVAGRFATVNGVPKAHLVKLLPAGNVDLNFATPAAIWGTGVELLPSGRILFSGVVDASGMIRIFRLNSDGTSDDTFTMDAAIETASGPWEVDSSGRIIFFGKPAKSSNPRLYRLFGDGGIDTSFDPNLTVYADVYALLKQSDGRVIVTGTFSQMNGVAKARIARVNADGTLDPTFDPGIGFDLPPYEIIQQPDGKLIVIGDFTSFNGTPRSRIARLKADGSLDDTFTVQVPSAIRTVALQPDGKILIGGDFLTVNGMSRTKIARLESNGGLDAAFNPVFGNGSIEKIIVLQDQKILVGGSFSGVNGFNRSNLVRLEAGGTLDAAYDPPSFGLSNMWLQPDGKLVRSNNTTLSRLNADGTLDSGFSAPNFSTSSSGDQRLDSLAIMSDGSMVVGGRFDFVGQTPRQNLTRLSSDGTWDPLFLPRGTNDRVATLVKEPGVEKVLIGGDLTTVNKVSRAGIARLNISAFRVVTPFDYDGDGISDVSVFRASESKWYVLRSSDFGVTQQTFAIAGDVPVPADYDGDGKTDFAIFRPSSGDWWYLSSVTSQQVFAHWGVSGDIPLPSDFDGNGRADYVVFRPSSNTWYRLSSTTGQFQTSVFGLAGDKPLIGDFDGDGKSDLAVYRPSDGNWWWQSSVDGIHRATNWGISTDIPVPADYDGDGKTDFAAYRPSTGTWWIYNSSDASFTIGPFGVSEDIPVPADFDGDGRADRSVFRPSSGIWYELRSSSGFSAFQFGISSDTPTQAAFQQ